MSAAEAGWGVCVGWKGHQDTTRGKKGNITRHTQAGIGHSPPTHRGGHVQDRSRHRRFRRVLLGAKTDLDCRMGRLRLSV